MRLRIVARKSPLALAQAQAVSAALSRLRTPIQADIIGVSTRGDQITDRPLADIGGKELFVKALQAELLENRAHFAVHSLKDMAAAAAPPFILAAVGFAEDPRDAVVSRQNLPLQELPNGAIVGTSSPRRAALITRHFPRLKIAPIRGNLQTRLAKMQSGQCHALILAAAGLRRMGMQEHIAQILPADLFIPAVGQGILAVECATPQNAALAAAIDDPAVRIRALAERAFCAKIGGDCHTPLGAHAVVENNKVHIRAFLADKNGAIFRAESQSPQSEPEQCGIAAAENILNQARAG